MFSAPVTLCDDPEDSGRNTGAELEELIWQRLEDEQEGLSHVEIVSDEECSDVSISNKGPKLPLSNLVQYSSSEEDSACPGPSRLPSVVCHKSSTEQHLIENTTSTLIFPEPVTPVSPAIPPPEHEGELKYISKYLIQYVPVKPQKVSAAGKRAPGARMLTSDECVQILKEQKEKKELEEKAKRKAEREQKKKESEEAAKEKAEKRKEAARKKAEEKERA